MRRKSHVLCIIKYKYRISFLKKVQPNIEEVQYTTKVTSKEDESDQESIDEPQMESSSEDSNDADEEVHWDALVDEAE